MRDLIERLEKATGPDRALDRAIFEAASLEAQFTAHNAESWFCTGDCSSYGFNRKTGEVVWAGAIPHFTGSVDDARTLVPEGWSYRVGENEPRTNAQAVLGRSHPTNQTIAQEAHTPAIALCIAALKAREALPARPKEGGER